MARRGAASRWIFPENFFSNTVECLGTARTSLFFAYINARVESAYLILHDFGTVYYHFSGTRVDRGRIGIDTLMFYELACWSRSLGYQRCYLGGGVTRRDDDSLLIFKSGFSSDRAPLYNYFCVHDRAAYDELCLKKCDFEIKTTGRQSTSSFMPLYRRENTYGL
jgi:hypothetical protein